MGLVLFFFSRKRKMAELGCMKNEEHRKATNDKKASQEQDALHVRGSYSAPAAAARLHVISQWVLCALLSTRSRRAIAQFSVLEDQGATRTFCAQYKLGSCSCCSCSASHRTRQPSTSQGPNKYTSATGPRLLSKLRNFTS